MQSRLCIIFTNTACIGGLACVPVVVSTLFLADSNSNPATTTLIGLPIEEGKDGDKILKYGGRDSTYPAVSPVHTDSQGGGGGDGV